MIETLSQYVSPVCEVCNIEIESPILSVSDDAVDKPAIGGPDDIPWL